MKNIKLLIQTSPEGITDPAFIITPEGKEPFEVEIIELYNPDNTDFDIDNWAPIATLSSGKLAFRYMSIVKARPEKCMEHEEYKEFATEFLKLKIKKSAGL